MGLFGRKVKFTDRIWLDTNRKFQDIVNALRSAKSQNSMPLCVYHFNETGKIFTAHLKEAGFRVHKLSSLSEIDTSTPEAWLSRTDVILFDSDLINEHHIKGNKRGSPGKDTPYSLHLLERYPIPEPDDRILAFVTKHRDIAPPTAYVALSEPWLTHLMGDRVAALLETMGLDENECIEHTLISNSIRKAQEKLAEKVRRDYPYDSVEAWLAGNIQS